MNEAVRTAAEAMLTIPVRHPLSVSPAGYLEAVMERDDLTGCQALDAAAAPLGRLAGRAVPAAASLAEAHRTMTATGRRRAAVTSADGLLLLSVKSVDRIQVTRQPQRATAATIALARLER